MLRFEDRASPQDVSASPVGSTPATTLLGSQPRPEMVTPCAPPSSPRALAETNAFSPMPRLLLATSAAPPITIPSSTMGKTLTRTRGSSKPRSRVPWWMHMGRCHEFRAAVMLAASKILKQENRNMAQNISRQHVPAAAAAGGEQREEAAATTVSTEAEQFIQLTSGLLADPPAGFGTETLSKCLEQLPVPTAYTAEMARRGLTYRWDGLFPLYGYIPLPPSCSATAPRWASILPSVPRKNVTSMFFLQPESEAQTSSGTALGKPSPCDGSDVPPQLLIHVFLLPSVPNVVLQETAGQFNSGTPHCFSRPSPRKATEASGRHSERGVDAKENMLYLGCFRQSMFLVHYKIMWNALTEVFQSSAAPLLPPHRMAPNTAAPGTPQLSKPRRRRVGMHFPERQQHQQPQSRPHGTVDSCDSILGRTSPLHSLRSAINCRAPPVSTEQGKCATCAALRAGRRRNAPQQRARVGAATLKNRSLPDRALRSTLNSTVETESCSGHRSLNQLQRPASSGTVSTSPPFDTPLLQVQQWVPTRFSHRYTRGAPIGRWSGDGATLRHLRSCLPPPRDVIGFPACWGGSPQTALDTLESAVRTVIRNGHGVHPPKAAGSGRRHVHTGGGPSAELTLTPPAGLEVASATSAVCSSQVHEGGEVMDALPGESMERTPASATTPTESALQSSTTTVPPRAFLLPHDPLLDEPDAQTLCDTYNSVYEAGLEKRRVIESSVNTKSRLIQHERTANAVASLPASGDDAQGLVDAVLKELHPHSLGARLQLLRQSPSCILAAQRVFLALLRAQVDERQVAYADRSGVMGGPCSDGDSDLSTVSEVRRVGSEAGDGEDSHRRPSSSRSRLSDFDDTGNYYSTDKYPLHHEKLNKRTYVAFVTALMEVFLPVFSESYLAQLAEEEWTYRGTTNNVRFAVFYENFLCLSLLLEDLESTQEYHMSAVASSRAPSHISGIGAKGVTEAAATGHGTFWSASAWAQREISTHQSSQRLQRASAAEVQMYRDVGYFTTVWAYVSEVVVPLAQTKLAPSGKCHTSAARAGPAPVSGARCASPVPDFGTLSRPKCIRSRTVVSLLPNCNGSLSSVAPSTPSASLSRSRGTAAMTTLVGRRWRHKQRNFVHGVSHAKQNGGGDGILEQTARGFVQSRSKQRCELIDTVYSQRSLFPEAFDVELLSLDQSGSEPHLHASDSDSPAHNGTCRGTAARSLDEPPAPALPVSSPSIGTAVSTRPVPITEKVQLRVLQEPRLLPHPLCGNRDREGLPDPRLPPLTAPAVVSAKRTQRICTREIARLTQLYSARLRPKQPPVRHVRQKMEWPFAPAASAAPGGLTPPAAP